MENFERAFKEWQSKKAKQKGKLKKLGTKVNNKFDNKAVNKYVSTISEKDRSKLFTRANYESYKKSNDTRLINNYSGYVDPHVRT